jgi:hypothetical protein
MIRFLVAASVALALAACSGGSGPQQPPPPPPPAPAHLATGSTATDLGVVKGGTHSYVWTITNTGGEPTGTPGVAVSGADAARSRWRTPSPI